MSKKIIVYEAFVPTSDGRDFMYYKLEPLLTNLKRKWEESELPKNNVDIIFKCPAFQRSLANTFVYKSPYDLEVYYDEQGRYRLRLPTAELNDDHTEPAIDTTTGREDNHAIQLFTGKSNKFLFATTSCELTIEQPYFHNKEHTILSGTFNIGKWFRPIHPALINLEKKNVSIKRGDALLYLKFPKDVKIEIRRTYLGPRGFNLSMGCGGYKIYDRLAPLEKLYKYFEEMAPRKNLIRELEENRIN